VNRFVVVCCVVALAGCKSSSRQSSGGSAEPALAGPAGPSAAGSAGSAAPATGSATGGSGSVGSGSAATVTAPAAAPAPVSPTFAKLAAVKPGGGLSVAGVHPDVELTEQPRPGPSDEALIRYEHIKWSPDRTWVVVKFNLSCSDDCSDQVWLLGPGVDRAIDVMFPPDGWSVVWNPKQPEVAISYEYKKPKEEIQPYTLVAALDAKSEPVIHKEVSRATYSADGILHVKDKKGADLTVSGGKIVKP
jgi:hypothetical protein